MYTRYLPELELEDLRGRMLIKGLSLLTNQLKLNSTVISLAADDDALAVRAVSLTREDESAGLLEAEA